MPVPISWICPTMTVPFRETRARTLTVREPAARIWRASVEASEVSGVGAVTRATADRATLFVDFDHLDDVLARDTAIVNRNRAYTRVGVYQLELDGGFAAASPPPQYGRIAALPRSTPVGEKPRSAISGDRISKSST